MFRVIIVLLLIFSKQLIAEPLDDLMEGNQRFINQKLKLCIDTAYARESSAQTQRPIAAIVCCSDARVPPDLIFDQKLGSLFVVRMAGNLVDSYALGSLEYAVKNLGVSLIVVLGHTRCGVIESFLKTIKDHQFMEGHIESLVLGVYPAIKNVKDIKDYSVDDLIKANVITVAEKIKNTPPILNEAFNENRVKIAGAVYDLDTGEVKLVK